MLNFEKFLENHSVEISDDEREELSQKSNGFNTKEDARDELDYLLDTDYPGGYRNMPDHIKLYRIIFLDEESYIDEDKLGQHWIMNSDLIDDMFIKKIKETSGSGGDPIIIQGTFITKDIDWKETLNNNMEFPREFEVTAGDLTPIDYKIYTLEKFRKSF